MINWKRVLELRDEVGADEFPEVIDLFLEEVDEVVDRLRATPNPETYEEDLHFLKGSALNLGFASFGDMCQDGEATAAEGRQTEVALDPILECYTQSRAQFLTQVEQKVAA